MYELLLLGITLGEVAAVAGVVGAVVGEVEARVGIRHSKPQPISRRLLRIGQGENIARPNHHIHSMNLSCLRSLNRTFQVSA